MSVVTHFDIGGLRLSHHATLITTSMGTTASYVGRAAKQLANDMELLADPFSGINKVTWQFFTNANHVIGPDVALLQKLKDNGIAFVLWLP